MIVCGLCKERLDDASMSELLLHRATCRFAEAHYAPPPVLSPRLTAGDGAGQGDTPTPGGQAA